MGTRDEQCRTVKRFLSRSLLGFGARPRHLSHIKDSGPIYQSDDDTESHSEDHHVIVSETTKHSEVQTKASAKTTKDSEIQTKALAKSKNSTRDETESNQKSERIEKTKVVKSYVETKVGEKNRNGRCNDSVKPSYGESCGTESSKSRNSVRAGDDSDKFTSVQTDKAAISGKPSKTRKKTSRKTSKPDQDGTEERPGEPVNVHVSSHTKSKTDDKNLKSFAVGCKKSDRSPSKTKKSVTELCHERPRDSVSKRASQTNERSKTDRDLGSKSEGTQDSLGDKYPHSSKIPVNVKRTSSEEEHVKASVHFEASDRDSRQPKTAVDSSLEITKNLQKVRICDSNCPVKQSLVFENSNFTPSREGVCEGHQLDDEEDEVWTGDYLLVRRGPVGAEAGYEDSFEICDSCLDTDFAERPVMSGNYGMSHPAPSRGRGRRPLRTSPTEYGDATVPPGLHSSNAKRPSDSDSDTPSSRRFCGENRKVTRSDRDYSLMDTPDGPMPPPKSAPYWRRSTPESTHPQTGGVEYGPNSSAVASNKENQPFWQDSRIVEMDFYTEPPISNRFMHGRPFEGLPHTPSSAYTDDSWMNLSSPYGTDCSSASSFYQTPPEFQYHSPDSAPPHQAAPVHYNTQQAGQKQLKSRRCFVAPDSFSSCDDSHLSSDSRNVSSDWRQSPSACDQGGHDSRYVMYDGDQRNVVSNSYYSEEIRPDQRLVRQSSPINQPCYNANSRPFAWCGGQEQRQMPYGQSPRSPGINNFPTNDYGDAMRGSRGFVRSPSATVYRPGNYVPPQLPSSLYSSPPPPPPPPPGPTISPVSPRSDQIGGMTVRAACGRGRGRGRGKKLQTELDNEERPGRKVVETARQSDPRRTNVPQQSQENGAPSNNRVVILDSSQQSDHTRRIISDVHRDEENLSDQYRQRTAQACHTAIRNEQVEESLTQEYDVETEECCTDLEHGNGEDEGRDKNANIETSGASEACSCSGESDSEEEEGLNDALKECLASDEDSDTDSRAYLSANEYPSPLVGREKIRESKRVVAETVGEVNDAKEDNKEIEDGEIVQEDKVDLPEEDSSSNQVAAPPGFNPLDCIKQNYWTDSPSPPPPPGFTKKDKVRSDDTDRRRSAPARVHVVDEESVDVDVQDISLPKPMSVRPFTISKFVTLGSVVKESAKPISAWASSSGTASVKPAWSSGVAEPKNKSEFIAPTSVSTKVPLLPGPSLSTTPPTVSRVYDMNFPSLMGAGISNTKEFKSRFIHSPEEFPWLSATAAQNTSIRPTTERRSWGAVGPRDYSHLIKPDASPQGLRSASSSDSLDMIKESPKRDWRVTHRYRLDSGTVPYIDSHCHIDFLFNRSKYQGTWTSYRQQFPDSFMNNYAGCITNFCDPNSYRANGRWHSVLDEQGVWAAFGCHPKSVSQFSYEREIFLRNMMSNPKVVALGEIGLDYSGRFGEQADMQKEAFDKQLEIAVKFQKPLVIHCRQAEEDCLNIMKKRVPHDWPIHRHCFTDDWPTAQPWLDYFTHCYLGLTPVVTYKHAREVHQVARMVPLNRLLLETDAPYFVPSYVSKAQMMFSTPGFAVCVADEVARLRAMDLDEVLTVTRDNTRKMYGV